MTLVGHEEVRGSRLTPPSKPSCRLQARGGCPATRPGARGRRCRLGLVGRKTSDAAADATRLCNGGEDRVSAKQVQSTRPPRCPKHGDKARLDRRRRRKNGEPTASVVRCKSQCQILLLPTYWFGRGMSTGLRRVDVTNSRQGL